MQIQQNHHHVPVSVPINATQHYMQPVHAFGPGHCAPTFVPYQAASQYRFVGSSIVHNPEQPMQPRPHTFDGPSEPQCDASASASLYWPYYVRTADPGAEVVLGVPPPPSAPLTTADPRSQAVPDVVLGVPPPVPTARPSVPPPPEPPCPDTAGHHACAEFPVPSARGLERDKNGVPVLVDRSKIPKFLAPAVAVQAKNELTLAGETLRANGSLSKVTKRGNNLSFLVRTPWDKHSPNCGPVLPFPLNSDPRLSDEEVVLFEKVGMLDLLPDVTDEQPWSLKTAFQMMLLSKLAYQPFTSTLWRTLYRGGYDKVILVQDDNTEYIVLHTPGKPAVVVFRGTDSATDWYYNILAMHVAPQNKEINKLVATLLGRSHFAGSHHSGFSKKLKKCFPCLSAILMTELPAGTPVILTGHSAGAALAPLAGTLLSLWYGMRVAAVYTFGQPNYARGDGYGLRDVSVHPDRFFRFVHHKDTITRVPLTMYEPRPPCYIDSHGLVHRSPPAEDVAAAHQLASFIQADRRAPRDRANSKSPSRIFEHCGSCYMRPLMRAAIEEAHHSGRPLFTPARVTVPGQFWTIYERPFDIDISPKPSSDHDEHMLAHGHVEEMLARMERDREVHVSTQFQSPTADGRVAAVPPPPGALVPASEAGVGSFCVV